MPACVELRLPNCPEYVVIARLTVAGVASRMAFDVETIEDMKIAVSEACTNAIEHGCPDGAPAVITLCYEIHPNELVITIQDPGRDFVPPTPKPTPPGGGRQGGTQTLLLNERGFGMLLIESLMDEFTISSREDGTQVRMVKRLRTPEVEER